MDGLFDLNLTPSVRFAGFGPSEFARRTATSEPLDLSADPCQVRRQLRASCPCRPGVYGMLDPRHELIYVGVSRRLRDRVLTYFTKGPPESKGQRIAASTAQLVWEVGSHELTAQLRELELIRRWRPRFNARGRPGRHELGYVYLAAGEAPNFRAGRRPPRSSRYRWGPLPLTRRVRAAVKRLNHVFHLRDCPDRTPVRYVEQMSLLPVDGQPACMRGELGTCLAPCSGDRAQREYTENVDAARPCWTAEIAAYSSRSSRR